MIDHKYTINSVNIKNKINRKEQTSEMNHYYAFATMELLLAMSEEKQKAVYDFITKLKDLKQEKGEEEATAKPTTAEKPNPYTINNTMRLLGHQCISGHLDKFRDMYNDVIHAHPYEGTFDICIDMFSLGIICGKRLDREKGGLASAKE